MYLKNLIASAVAAVCVSSPALAVSVEEAYPEIYPEISRDWRAVFDTIDLKQGVQSLELVELDIPEGFYFLDAEDSETVLHTVWGNPPAEGVLGMIFPKEGFFVENWGVEITYEDIGHVSDKDAADIDYTALMKDMQRDTRAENQWRRDNGYPSVDLVGWAEAPHYEAAENKLYWAKELTFEGDGYNSLNYNIRILGREGVLVLNFIAAMDQFAEVKAALPAVLDMPSFTPGNQYADFNPSTDTLAAVGIGGLIAGKALTKTGLAAAAVLFLKKFWFLLFLPLIGLKNFVFGRRT